MNRDTGLYIEALELSWAHRDQITGLLTRMEDAGMRERAQAGYIAALDGGITAGLQNYDETRVAMESLLPYESGIERLYVPRRSLSVEEFDQLTQDAAA